MALQQQSPPNTWAAARDDELAHWQIFYTARLRSLDDELTEDRPAMTREDLAPYAPKWRAFLLSSGATRAVSAAELRASTAAFLRGLLGDIDAERARRERRKRAGAPEGQGGFPPEWVRDLKARTNLDALFELEAQVHFGRVSARQRRRGICPFCGGTDPTKFCVTLGNADDQHWRCFACGQSGDAITAIELLYNVDFRGACLILATHAGQPLPESMRPAAAPDPNRYLHLARGGGADA